MEVDSWLVSQALLSMFVSSILENSEVRFHLSHLVRTFLWLGSSTRLIYILCE
jgi:hypothetical protein